MGRRSRAITYIGCQPTDEVFLVRLLAMPLLSNRIAMARKRAGYRTQAAFADAIGVSRGLVGQWETVDGKRPGRDNLLKIADLCGITVEYLVGNAPETRVISNLSAREIELVLLFRRLNDLGQENFLKTLQMIFDPPTVTQKKTEKA